MSRNTNCLAGIRCPRCASLGGFKIVSTCQVYVTDDGTEDAEGFEWADDSPCHCCGCGYPATVADFKLPKLETLLGELGDNITWTMDILSSTQSEPKSHIEAAEERRRLFAQILEEDAKHD